MIKTYPHLPGEPMSQRHPAHASQTLRILLAGVCVLLILFIGAAQVLHTHTAAEAANPGCSLCAVAHLSVLTAPVATSPVPVATTAPIRAAEIAPPPPRLFSFATYVRPPPVLTSRS